MASGIAYGFVPKYACGIGGLGADGEILKSCRIVASGQPCCDKASNMGWRYLLYTLGAICLFIFFMRFVVFRFQESPKYLLYRGKDEKAVEVLHKIAKFNGRQSSITLESFAALADEDSSVGSAETGKSMLGAGTNQRKTPFKEQVMFELARYKLLFANSTIARLTILVWITYMFDYWGFSIAGMYIRSCDYTDCRLISLNRFASTANFASEEPRDQSLHGGDVPKLCDYLHLRHSWGVARCSYVRCSPRRTTMGHGSFIGSNGGIALPLLGHQYTSIQCWHQHHGVFLSEHVQCVRRWQILHMILASC